MSAQTVTLHVTDIAQMMLGFAERQNPTLDGAISVIEAVAARRSVAAPTANTLTDEQIIECAIASRSAEAGRDGGYILPISFARAILALLPAADAAQREDAERYRLLRTHEAASILNVLVDEWDFFGDAGKQLDAAIDAQKGSA